MQDQSESTADTQDAYAAEIKYKVKTLPNSAKLPLSPEEVTFVYFLMDHPNLNLNELVEELNNEFRNSLGNGEVVWPKTRVKQYLRNLEDKGIFEESSPVKV